MTRRPAVRSALIVVAVILGALALGLPVAGSYWATDARRTKGQAAAQEDRAEQTRLIRAMVTAGQKMQRNQLKLCAAARLECER